MRATGQLSTRVCEEVAAARLGQPCAVAGVEVRAGCDKPLGFMAEYSSVLMHVDSGGRRRVLHFFAKEPPSKVDFRSRYVAATKGFLKESTFYSDIFPHLRKYVCSDRPCLPDCYLATDTLILLKDLTIGGYKGVNPTVPFDYDQCSLVLKALSKLHAASIALEYEWSKDCTNLSLGDEEFAPVFEEALFVSKDNPMLQDSFRASLDASLCLVEQLSTYGKHSQFYEKTKELYDEKWQCVFGLVRRSDCYRNVICHGDVWANNFLFRYDDDDLPVEVRLVDFQMVRFVPPAVDVACMLYMTTTKEFRNLHVDDLLKFYHESLTDNLVRQGVPSEERISWSELKDSWQDYKLPAAMYAEYCLQLTLLPPDVIGKCVQTDEDLKRFLCEDRKGVVLEAFNSNLQYKCRLTDLLEEVVENSILKLS